MYPQSLQMYACNAQRTFEPPTPRLLLSKDRVGRLERNWSSFFDPWNAPLITRRKTSRASKRKVDARAPFKNRFRFGLDVAKRTYGCRFRYLIENFSLDVPPNATDERTLRARAGRKTSELELEGSLRERCRARFHADFERCLVRRRHDERGRHPFVIMERDAWLDCDAIRTSVRILRPRAKENNASGWMNRMWKGFKSCILQNCNPK